ncbi:MAG: universal stress protein UspA [Bacteroidetes bacterium CG23_combo_of_CG06-09_8_20_14_all_32_9]|nr:MAG: universal stress protein UspA [Bacteroidetes bacterium CG23_combo_of_CG06-09_8_20_14_all_32_9]
MEKSKKTILVPWDFTEVAENALLHAVRLVKTINVTITLLHIVNKQKDEANILPKLQQITTDASKKYNVEVNSLIKEGNIFSSIKKCAEELNATFVVMGTHGIKGMQKLTGSWALKVIANSSVPFIVVQGEPEHEAFAKTVIPIDFSQESKEKLRWAVYISTYFKTKIYLFILHITNESLLRRTKANVSFARKYLDERDISYEITESQVKGKFSEQTLNFATEIDADMIIIMTTKQPRLTDYVFAAIEQQIIANSAKIPVMCINPRTDTKMLTGFY